MLTTIAIAANPAAISTQATTRRLTVGALSFAGK